MRPIGRGSSKLLWLPYVAFLKRHSDIRLLDAFAPNQALLAPHVRHLGLAAWYVVKFKRGAHQSQSCPILFEGWI